MKFSEKTQLNDLKRNVTHTHTHTHTHSHTHTHTHINTHTYSHTHTHTHSHIYVLRYIMASKSHLPHSYYFTTHILVLKFVSKGISFEEIQDSHFPRKRGYFGTHLCEFVEKGIIFYVQCFTVKRGVHLGWQVSVLPQKGGSFWTEKSAFYRKKGSFWAKKSMFCRKKGGNFQTGEQGWVPLFPVSEGAEVSPRKRGSFSNWRTRRGTLFSVSEGGGSPLVHLDLISDQK